MAGHKSSNKVVRGPDLNETKPEVDPKVYRQIVLPNGLRAVLVQDTLAMREGPVYTYEDGDSDDDSSASGDEKSGSQEESDDETDDGENGGSAQDAAVSLLVGAGSIYDPPSCQGLAHFLEHLLFMGSEKYPGENDFSAFVSKHGGSENAYTDWEVTNYHLSIPQPYLWGALDRLAQFFIAPLMLENAVDRELQAIESEFKLNKNSDSCRFDQLLCATSRPDHPMAKFSWGNIRSLKEIPALLGVDPMKELRSFFDRYYYAANMRLCVIGAFSLDEMEKRVVGMFSSVPSLPREEGPFALPVDPNTIGSFDCEYRSPIENAGFPLPKTSLAKIYRIIPVKEKYSITITFQIPRPKDHWKSKPADFLSHLIGHEASGSLLSYFRSNSLASKCVAGVSEEDVSSHMHFFAAFTSSESGLNRWHDIVGALYQYIGMLRGIAERGWPEWIYEELKSIHEVAYRYRDEEAPDEAAETIVEDMAPHAKIPAERLLDGTNLLFEFDTDAVMSILDGLRPENARIDIMSSSFGQYEDSDLMPELPAHSTETLAPDLVFQEEPESMDVGLLGKPYLEPMFETLFWASSVPDTRLSEWTSFYESPEPLIPVSLPPQNPFVPESFDLKPLPTNDSRHPLLFSAFKLCLPVGKSKQWFSGTAIQYDAKKESLLFLFEDDTEQWHKLDQPIDFFTPEKLRPGFDSTLDKKKIKFRVVEIAKRGDGPIRRYGDASDDAVLEGRGFPPIPPALPPSRLPKQIHNSNSLKMWYLQDRNYDRPIAELRLQILCAKGNSSPVHQACAELLVGICQDKCLETSYLAELCELSCSLSATDYGFKIRVCGFHDKLLTLFELYFATFLSFRGQTDELPEGIQLQRFNEVREILRRGYRNRGLAASGLVGDVRLEALRPTIWSVGAKLDALKDITVATFAKISSEILEQAAIECLFHGNVDESSARSAKNTILSNVDKVGLEGLPRKKYPSQSVLRVPKSTSCLDITLPSKNSTEPNSAVEVYIQVGRDNLRERTLIELTSYMMDEPFYDQVRTKDQFGYDVDCDNKWSWGVLGIVFSIVTNDKSAAECVARVDEFLTQYRRELIEMSDADFLEHAVGLSAEKLELFTCLSEEAGFYWSEICDGKFEWQSYRDEAIVLRDIKKADVLEFFDKWLNPGGKRNIATFQVIGNGDGAVAAGRPEVEAGALYQYHSDQVEAFHKGCKGQTCGRINSKLF